MARLAAFGGHLGVISLHLGAFLLGNFDRHHANRLGLRVRLPSEGKKKAGSHGARLG